MRKERGITLIALIITIIILIILTAITISNVVNSNLFGLAKGAAENYIQAGKEESGTIDNLLSRVETIGKRPDEDLYRYILGKEKTGRDMSEISNIVESIFGDISTLKFTPDKEMKTDISDKISGLTSRGAALYREEEPNKNVYIKYEDKVYRVTVKIGMGKVFSTTLTKIYEPRGNEGKTVQYSYDGSDENKKDWTIIKDNQNGTVDIVSPDVLGELTLGKQAVASSDYPVVEGLEKSIEDYNEAIKKINDKCKEVVTNKSAIKVRSVGAAIDNTETKFKSDLITEWANNEQQFLSSYNGRGKEGDIYDEDDLVRMSYYGVANLEGRYWVASRFILITYTLDWIGFFVNTLGGDDFFGSLWQIATNGAFSDPITYGVRPVVTINYPISE